MTRDGDPLTKSGKFAAFLIALLIRSTAACLAASPESGRFVEFESPLAAAPPLQGILREAHGAGRSPAVVLLHGCDGDWRQLDLRWGKLIASWGYVALTVDSFGPRGLSNTCNNGSPVSLAFDAYRALGFLVQQPVVDPDRVAALGFAQGGWLALTSVERGAIERTAQHKFRSAIAFYPRCAGFKDDMTVPTLILIGELDEWSRAIEGRNLVDGRDDLGISRNKGKGITISLVVFPNAYHGFDSPALRTPAQYLGYCLEFNRAATDQSIDAVRKFLDATIGGRH